ncbi:hypothetical protein PWT90_07696 [Aphanocladium album]|nr:hypothetical protein PWT90_07696 [Aphanocladium album]
MQANEKYCLYSFFSSPCCHRVIIAAHLKSLPLTLSYIDLRDDALARYFKQDAAFSAQIPTLVVTHGDGTTTIVPQAANILEYFEKRFPDTYPMLPPAKRPKARALTREFASILNFAVHPEPSCGAGKRASVTGGSLGFEEQEIFTTFAFRDGFAAYQALLQSSRGSEARTCLYTVGDCVTLADICLVPAVEQAITFSIDMSCVPDIMRIYNHLRTLPEFSSNIGWRKQLKSHRRL